MKNDLDTLRELLRGCFEQGRDICDGPACTGCWKDQVREALKILDRLSEQAATAEPEGPRYEIFMDVNVRDALDAAWQAGRSSLHPPQQPVTGEHIQALVKAGNR